MAKSKLIETGDFDKLSELLSQTKASSLVLLDIDDTVITPVSAMFAGNSEHRSFIDDLKKNSSKYPNFDKMLENFRLTRKVKLIDSNWVKLIEQIKNTGAGIYALTQLSGEKVGKDSLKQWRYKELSSLGINFTRDFDRTSDLVVIEAEKNDSALFYKGIFITGASKKGVILEKIFEKMKPSEVMFIDDRKGHIDDLAEVCEKEKIDYLGIHYTGAMAMTTEINQDVIKLQQTSFTEQGEWLEDQEAYALLKLSYSQ